MTQIHSPIKVRTDAKTCASCDLLVLEEDMTIYMHYKCLHSRQYCNPNMYACSLHKLRYAISPNHPKTSNERRTQ
jgi:hypothetical protein